MDKKSNFKMALRSFMALLAIFSLCPGILSAQTVLTLEKAKELVMNNSPTIMHSKMDLEMKQESLNAQQAATKSKFSLSLSPYKQTNNRAYNELISDWNTSWTKASTGTFTIAQPLKWTDGTFTVNNELGWQKGYSEYSATNEPGSYSNSVYFSYEQPIFTYNRTMLTIRSLELNLEDSQLSYNMQMLSLEKQVSTYFYAVYKQKASYDISVEEYKNQLQSYEIIKNKVDAGLSAKEELFQAELNLASSKATMENSQVSLENAYDTLKQLVGISLDDSVTVEADVSFQFVSVDLRKALDNAQKSRMELRQRRIDILNAQNDLIQTAAENEFKGSVNLSYGLTGTDESVGSVYNTTAKRKTIGLTFDVPLWDWGQKKSLVKAAKLKIDDQKLSLEEDKIDINIAIRQSYRELNNLVSQIDIASQNVRNAQLTYDINLERYKNGDLTSMDLNLYQTQLSEKKTSYTEALIDYRLALLNMKIISLWDFENNQQVLPVDTSNLDFNNLKYKK